MRNPAKKFIELIKDQESAEILKGNFSPLQSNKKIEEIKQIITFQSKRKNFPNVFFYGKHKNYLGTIIARHSSDLLTMIANKMLALMKFRGIYLIQYQLSKRMNGIQLISLFKWENIDDFEEILENLEKIQSKFVKLIKKIANLAVDS
ncbi:MAG: hypothetical protein ACTSWX_00580 [Promethearchaeota archaeon]